MFKDRAEAAEQLAERLSRYQGGHTLVLAIPQGGVEVGHYLAKNLRAHLSPVMSRRLPDPLEPGTGFGAVAEDGCLVIDKDIYKWLSTAEINAIKKEQNRLIKKWVKDFRQGKPLPEMPGQTVILVDDGMATGFTMKAAIAVCRKKGAQKIVVAVPVAEESAAREIEQLVDETIVLEVLDSSRGGGESYVIWPDVPVERIQEILRFWESE
ncbi:MAG: phosphoribosyltransferase family protein [Acidobacteriota bacterium]